MIGPTEVRVQDATGQMLKRAVRTYDTQGRLSEEKQIVDRPELMIPAETRAGMMEQSGLSADQLDQWTKSYAQS